MKTVILDACTVTKGDLDMSPLSAFGEVEYYDILTPEKIIEVLALADAVVCNKSVIDRRIIDATSLKFIGVFATGYNNIDIDYAKEIIYASQHKAIILPISRIELAPTSAIASAGVISVNAFPKPWYAP